MHWSNNKTQCQRTQTFAWWLKMLGSVRYDDRFVTDIRNLTALIYFRRSQNEFSANPLYFDFRPWSSVFQHAESLILWLEIESYLRLHFGSQQQIRQNLIWHLVRIFWSIIWDSLKSKLREFLWVEWFDKGVWWSPKWWSRAWIEDFLPDRSFRILIVVSPCLLLNEHKEFHLWNHNVCWPRIFPPGLIRSGVSREQSLFNCARCALRSYDRKPPFCERWLQGPLTEIEILPIIGKPCNILGIQGQCGFTFVDRHF
jgi:hypothetical protein